MEHKPDRAKSSSLPGYASRSSRPVEAPKKKKWGWSIFKRNKAPANDHSSDEELNKKKNEAKYPPKLKDRPVIDTLTPLQSDRSDLNSQSSLTRKERREAILARAQARRNGPGSTASSSDEERDPHHLSPSPLMRRSQNSQESLNCRLRSRSARTERFLQRRSRDEESLRREMAQEVPDYACYNQQRRWLSPTAPTTDSPVTLRQHQQQQRSHNNSENGSPAVGRVQSAVLAPPKLSTPPPPPPRNPLKKSYLLQVQEQKGRPTSFHAFGERGSMIGGPLHDYQNVDEQGRLVAPHPENRSGALHLPLPARVQSAVFPAAPQKSPSPFGAAERRPPWAAALAKSPTSPPPVREFWRSKETHQQQQQQQPGTPTTPKSARERLAPFQWTAGNAPVKSPVQRPVQQHHVRDLAKLKPSNDRHLEQAICELEQIYQSLRLDGDEDLLDRAERRDLPTQHQQLNVSGSESEPHQQGVTSDLDTMMNWSVSGSFESLATENRRTPRRSAVPDKVNDDMAVRRLRKSQSSEPQSVPAAQSYLLLSPSTVEQENQSGSGESRNSEEPDVVLDDVAFRHIRQANQSLKVADPQPPFGIPIGPVAPASPSDYLHSSVTAEQRELRPLMHPTKYPDLVRDDLAFRNLRKDVGHAQLVQNKPVNTEKLDEVLAETARGQKTVRKKRAVRSLSANIAQLIKRDAARPSGGGGPVDFDKAKSESEEEDERYIDRNPFEEARAQSLSDLLGDISWNNNNNNKAPVKTPRAVKQRSESKKKTVDNEVEEVAIVRQLRPSPSWVERAKLTDEEDRTPALAKLYPTSAILREKRAVSETPRTNREDTEDAEVEPLSGTTSSGKPPSGASSGENARWEESPLFQAVPRNQRSGSPADSSDSGQVSCCGREVRQILHEQIRRQEEERSGEDVQHDDACFSLVPCLPDELADWMPHEHPIPQTSTRSGSNSPAPIEDERAAVAWITSARGPGSDDGIDSLTTRSASSSPDAEWSRVATPEESDTNNNNVRSVVSQTDDRWREERWPVKAARRGWGQSHALRQVVWAGCVLASLFTLCGLDAATCAHLFLAFFALAAVFCEMH